ncbi:unnamed protein product [Orchesella dallaii]|uniref:Winged helix Storkhead-box1 domain-containing protein n=1 Tax=Orchesella dallaii TaxID=48710 RepID=A0ABP1QWY4_9HEXA
MGPHHHFLRNQLESPDLCVAPPTMSRHHSCVTGLASNNVLRKHLLLLQDCLVIKFIKHNFQNYQHDLDVGVTLFKCFREANSKCHWNLGMIEAISSLEYAGHVVPTTILVQCSSKHLNVIRTAWARRTLKPPDGYTIQLMGEMEELVADPIQQGQFSPLSDSICWSIYELTSSGQEAFVDSIMNSLSNGFPSMCIPPKELVYQTLEKLIRDQKIYQTSSGYYIVTPEVCVFMNSRSTTPAYSSAYSLSQNEKRVCYGSAACVFDEENVMYRKSKLTRHNSMKVIRNTYVSRPHMGARSLSFRLSKCNSLFDSDKEFSDNEETALQTSTLTDGQTQTELNKTKKRWFSGRWFSLRRLIPPRKQESRRGDTDSSSGYSSESSKQRCSSPASSVSAIYASIGNRTAADYSINTNCSPINKFDQYGDIEQQQNQLSSN